MYRAENEMLITTDEGCEFTIVMLPTCYFIISQLLFKISVANYYISILQIKLA